MSFEKTTIHMDPSRHTFFLKVEKEKDTSATECIIQMCITFFSYGSSSNGSLFQRSTRWSTFLQTRKATHERVRSRDGPIDDSSKCERYECTKMRQAIGMRIVWSFGSLIFSGRVPEIRENNSGPGKHLQK